MMPGSRGSRAEALWLLDRNFRDGGVARFNRVLLEDAYPNGTKARNGAAKIMFVRKRKGPSKFTLGERFDVASLAEILSRKAGLLPALLSGQMDARGQTVLAAYQVSKTNAPELETLMVDNFNRLISGPSLYDAARSSKTSLCVPKPMRCGESNPKGAELAWLNRMLLEDAYPRELTIVLPRTGRASRKRKCSRARSRRTRSASSLHLPAGLEHGNCSGVGQRVETGLGQDGNPTATSPGGAAWGERGEAGDPAGTGRQLLHRLGTECDGQFHPGRGGGNRPLFQAGALEELLQQSIDRAAGDPPTNAWWKDRLVMIGSRPPAMSDHGAHALGKQHHSGVQTFERGQCDDDEPLCHDQSAGAEIAADRAHGRLGRVDHFRGGASADRDGVDGGEWWWCIGCWRAGFTWRTGFGCRSFCRWFVPGSSPMSWR